MTDLRSPEQIRYDVLQKQLRSLADFHGYRGRWWSYPQREHDACRRAWEALYPRKAAAFEKYRLRLSKRPDSIYFCGPT
jgi:hypothetical protein